MQNIPRISAARQRQRSAAARQERSGGAQNLPAARPGAAAAAALASLRPVLYDASWEFQEISSARLSSKFPNMPLLEKAHLMTGSEINRTLVHLAHEIVEKTEALESLALIGIRRRGVPLAERLARKIEQISSSRVPVGTLDIRLYRDDLSAVDAKPVVEPTQISFPIAEKDVILVDDVLCTGRTTRAALDALFDHGRPRRVRLCVLIDRGHRELPIEASFVGKRVTTTRSESIEVKLQEIDEVEKVLLLETSAAGAASPAKEAGE